MLELGLGFEQVYVEGDPVAGEGKRPPVAHLLRPLRRRLYALLGLDEVREGPITQGEGEQGWLKKMEGGSGRDTG